MLEVLFAVEPSAQSASPAFVARSGGDAALSLAPYIAISWEPPVDDGAAPILGYRVEMINAATSPTTWPVVLDASTQPNATQFTFQSATLFTAGQTYSFRTYSLNVKGWSPASPAIDITAATIPTQMAAPTRTSVVIGAQTVVTISWLTPTTLESGGSPVTGYRIRRNYGYNTSVSSATEFEIANPATLSHVFTGELLLGATYKIVIAAFNDVHTSNSFAVDGSGVLNFSDELEITVANVPG